MKIKFNAILVAALAATTFFASCAKDNDNANAGDSNKATLNIGITAPQLSRAIAASDGAVPSDATITNFKAFVVDGDGTLKSGYSADGSAVNGIAVSTTASKIYVIANAGDITMANEAAILAYKADLNGTGAQSSIRWATGEMALSTADFIETAGEFVANKNVTLTFIASRITLKITNGMTGYSATNTNGDLVLKNVAVLNGRGESLLFGSSSLIPATYTTNKKFYEGLANPASPDDFHYYPATTDFTMATSLLSDAIPADDFTKTYYYYVFENDAATAATFPTIITLVAEFDGETIYYPVHLAPYEQWASGSATNFVTRGHSYDITVNLTVDPTAPGGSTDPTDPIINAKMNVSITLTPWIPVPLVKEF